MANIIFLFVFNEGIFFILKFRFALLAALTKSLYLTPSSLLFMPPVTTLPYSEAPVWCLPLFEISMYILFIFCFTHAVRKSIQHVSYLVAGVLFGLLLEYVNVISKHGLCVWKIYNDVWQAAARYSALHWRWLGHYYVHG